MDDTRSVRLQSLCGADLVDYLIQEQKKQQTMKLLRIEPEYVPYPMLLESEAKRDLLIAEKHLNPELCFLNF